MGKLLFFTMTVHINESSMENISSFIEVSIIVGVHINMDTSKEKVINVHMQERHILHFITCTDGLIYKTLIAPVWSLIVSITLLTPTIFYFHCETNSNIFTDYEVKGVRKVG